MKTKPNEPVHGGNAQLVECAGKLVLYGAGLTKREWFAGMAMQGQLASTGVNRHYVAKRSVDYADAIIKELNKNNG